MSTDHLEAIGPRGEACVIVRTESEADGGSKRYRYTLAAGDRLRPTDSIGVFETFDGIRRYRLRDPLTTENVSGDSTGTA